MLILSRKRGWGLGGMGFVGWGLWDGREQKVGFAEKKLRLCLAGLPCMAMPVQVRALRGGRKILKALKIYVFFGVF